MPLYRFGRSLIRLAEVVTMRDIPANDRRPGKVRVYFRGCRAVDYEDDDAAALRAYMEKGQPPPPCGESELARVVEPLDPSTGQAGNREAIGGA